MKIVLLMINTTKNLQIEDLSVLLVINKLFVLERFFGMKSIFEE